MAPYSDPYTTGTDIGPGQIMMLYLFPRTSETYILVLGRYFTPLGAGEPNIHMDDYAIRSSTHAQFLHNRPCDFLAPLSQGIKCAFLLT